jgi:hypothetical protein
MNIPICSTCGYDMKVISRSPTHIYLRCYDPFCGEQDSICLQEQSLRGRSKKAGGIEANEFAGEIIIYYEVCKV